MKLRQALCLAAVMALTGSLQAQVCSGGLNGGMDATGNDCNAPGSAAIGGAAQTSAHSGARPKVSEPSGPARSVTSLKPLRRGLRPTTTPRAHSGGARAL